jgi:hypothetical protein
MLVELKREQGGPISVNPRHVISVAANTTMTHVTEVVLTNGKTIQAHANYADVVRAISDAEAPRRASV